MIPVRFSSGGRERTLGDLSLPLDLEDLAPDSETWEVELGFGKGAYLLRRAAAEPECAFLGIEIVSKYYRLVRDRAARRNLGNVVLARGEALYLISAALPSAFARAVHVYHPDPWPKARHNKRRLFDTESIDLLLGLLAPEGRLYFATDHREYAEVVVEVLGSHPGLELTEWSEGWPEGPRTHYERKFVAAGTSILRLEVRLRPSFQLLHPEGRAGVLAATSARD